MAKASIYLDEQGRRRVDRSPQGPPAPDPRIAKLEQQLTAALATIEQLQSDLEFLKSSEITGEGFDGNLECGISWSGQLQGPPGVRGAVGPMPPGEWMAMELCDGTTFEGWVRNITPP